MGYLPRIESNFGCVRKRLFCTHHHPYHPSETEFLLNHARSGILLALKALNLPTGSKVGMSVYDCHTVMNAISQADLTPVFIDIDHNLRLSIQDLAEKSDDLDALIVSHLFGVPNDMATITNICHEIPIIEDCAHAYGIDSVGGTGCMAVYSIGLGKLPSIGDGGILKVNDPGYLQKVKNIYDTLPNYTQWQEIRLFATLSLRHLLYRPIIYRLFTRPLLKRNNNTTTHETIVCRRMSKGIQSIYNAVRNNITTEITRRRNTANTIISLLGSTESFTPITSSNGFMLPIICDSPAHFKEKLHRYGIESDTHFKKTILWAKDFGYEIGGCPTAEWMTCHLLVIPTYTQGKRIKFYNCPQ